MAKIVISYFQPTDLGLFMHNLNPLQCKILLGGYMYFNLMNIGGGINNMDNVYYLGSYALNFHDNRMYTMDYSRSLYNWFYF
jgi:hypothetical protein